MSEQKESSVLFSLKELMNLEEDRIKTEEDAKAAAAAAAERARVDAERAAREAEEARIRSEQERRRVEEQRSREENARLDAIRHAELEKARLDAEQRARLEAMAAQQQHERSLEQIKQDDSKKRLRNMLFIGAAAVVVLGSAGGYLAYDSAQKAQARAAADAMARAQAEEDTRKAKAAAEESQKKVESLITQLAGAKDDADRAKLQKQIDDERAKTEPTKRTGGPSGPARSSSGSDTPKKKCTPGDPLCTDI
jgi:colicin import membrane protein